MNIYPSLISSCLLSLGETLTAFDNTADGYHIDIMDDHFVPNLTWGPAFVHAMRKATKLPLHLHLMVDNPAQWIDRLPLQSPDTFIFHGEAVDAKGAQAIIERVKKHGAKVGIAINPDTSIMHISSFFDVLDEILIMSVHPGFSGQTFIEEVVPKVKKLIAMKQEKNFSFAVSMDGGIGKRNIADLAALGVNIVGIASAIFNDDDPVAALKKLKLLV